MNASSIAEEIEGWGWDFFKSRGLEKADKKETGAKKQCNARRAVKWPSQRDCNRAGRKSRLGKKKNNNLSWTGSGGGGVGVAGGGGGSWGTWRDNPFVIAQGVEAECSGVGA